MIKLTYDVIVLGGGPGGYVAAIRAAQKQLKVALIEREAIGGVCLNWGCIPTKSLLKSAKIYQQFLHAKDYGLVVDKANVGFDWEAIVQRKDKIVKRLTGGVGMLLKKNGVDVFIGEGKVTGANEIMVGENKLVAKNIILATGASPLVPPIDGLKDQLKKGFVLTSKGLLDIKKVPDKLVIIGGGVIGIEFATIFNTFGADVTIIEREDRILLNVDDDVREQMRKLLKRSKINVLTNATVTQVGENSVTYKNAQNQSESMPADRVLLSVGMKANNQAFASIGLEMDGHFVKINDQFQTSIDHIYAIGDVNGKMMLAHVASHQGIIAVDHILGDIDRMNYQQIPSAIYSFPEIAQVGLTEREAKDKGLNYKVSIFPIQANGKALSANERDGFIKIIAIEPYNEIVGVHILAEQASDLISEAVVAMKLEGTADDIAKAVHPHPTISEIFNEAAHGIVDFPIHI